MQLLFGLQIIMNILEIELFVYKHEYEDYANDYHDLTDDEKQKMIDFLGGREEYDDIRQEINESTDNGDEYVSKPYKFTTNMTTKEFEQINDILDDDCQWANYNFDLDIAHTIGSGFFHGIRWSLYENKKNEPYPEIPYNLKRILEEKLEFNS